jgi:hypothetical protein
MGKLMYVRLSEINPEDFLPLLNKATTREHLIKHELFTVAKIEDWIKAKIAEDNKEGCKVRAIMLDHQLAGWCAIQSDDGAYEIAVVIEDCFWGLGKTVFADVMNWAKALGHATVLIHLLKTRPEYKFLRKMASKVYESEVFGSEFLTYELAVDQVSRRANIPQ